MPTMIKPLMSSGSIVLHPRPLAPPVPAMGPGAAVLKPDQKAPLAASVGRSVDISA